MHKKKRICKYIFICAILILPVLFLVIEANEEEKIDVDMVLGDSIRVSFRDMVSCKIQVGEQKEEISFYSYDSEVNEYRLFLPAYSQAAQCSLHYPEGYKLLIENQFYESGRMISDIAFDIPYGFAYFTEDNELVETGIFVLRRSENIPSIMINTETQNAIGLEGQPSSGDIAIITENGEYLYDGGLEEIRVRGNSSANDNEWGEKKKPYHIELSEKATLFENVTAKGWILLANGARDKTYLNNKIVYDMAYELGMPFSPQSTFCDLYIDGTYYGNYLLCKRNYIKNSVMQDLQAENERMNPYQEWEETEVFVDEENSISGYRYHRVPHDITGGYIIEMQNRDSIGAFSVPVSASTEMECGIKVPQYAEEREVEYISSIMRNMAVAILAEDGYSPETGKYYLEYIDLESFVQKYLIEEITKNWDGGTGSAFYYKYQDEISDKIFAGPVWDYDGAFFAEIWPKENNGQNPYNINTLSQRDGAFGWYGALYEKEEFHNEMVSMYQEEFIPILQNMIEYRIDAYVNEIKASVNMDIERYGWDNAYEENIAYLKVFMDERMKYLNNVWLFKAYHQLTVYNEIQATRYYYLTNNDILTLYDLYNDDYEFMGYYDYVTGEKLQSNDINIAEDTKIIARWRKKE